MLFIFIISILGFAIGIRNSESLIDKNLFEMSMMTKIGTLFLALVLIFIFFLPRGHLSAWISIFVPLMIAAFAVFLLMKKRGEDFRVALIAALTLISLKMKAGRSFRQALSEVAAESEPDFRAKLSEIGSAVVFSPQITGATRGSTSDLSSQRSNPALMPLRASVLELTFSRRINQLVNDVIEELIRIDRQPHAALKRLNVLRDRLRLEDEFRRKSGQVLARIRAQALVMSGLYLALAVFIAVKFGWRENIRIFAISLILFSIGSLWIWLGGRSMKWSV